MYHEIFSIKVGYFPEKIATFGNIRTCMKIGELFDEKSNHVVKVPHKIGQSTYRILKL